MLTRLGSTNGTRYRGAAENHYPTMSIEDALFLWAMFPQLPEALRLIKAWGFTYKSVG